MIVTAWNNGAHMRSGIGYGFRVSLADRDELFKKDWTNIEVTIEGQGDPFLVSIDAEAFWSPTGHELHSKEIGLWLRKYGLAPWPMGKPPVFILNPTSENHFSGERVKKGKGK
jgi:hypothetical protein